MDEDEEMSRRKAVDIERSWYDHFARWTKEDRAAALNVLTILHQQLPDQPSKPEEGPCPRS